MDFDTSKKRRRRRRFGFFFLIGIAVSIIVPTFTAPPPQRIATCGDVFYSNYTSNYTPAFFSSNCITFLNNSLYFITYDGVFPFSIINDTVVFGPNQINGQEGALFANTYGCGRKDDTTIYISSESYALATISTIANNVTDLSGNPYLARGFALVNYTDLYSVYENSIYFNNTVLSTLILSDAHCINLFGYGLAWDPITKNTYIIYSRAEFLEFERRIGVVNLTTGIVDPTCVNFTEIFSSITFDSTGQLWSVLNIDNQYDVKRQSLVPPVRFLNFSKAPEIIREELVCNGFGTKRGSPIAVANNRFGNPTKLSGDGKTVIAGSIVSNVNNIFARVYRFFKSEWYQIGSTFNQPLKSLAISEDGNITAIGSMVLNLTRVYNFTNCTWVQIGNNIIGGGDAVSLSADGLTVALSNINDTMTNNTMGITYIYDWNGTTWNLRGNPIMGVNSLDYSGFDISLYGNNRIAIGIVEFNGTGRTEVYEWSGTAWIQLGLSIMGENLSDNSGNSVSLKNNIVAIGAWRNDNNGTESGTTRVYQWNGVLWNQLGQDLEGEAAFDYFGATVSLSDNGLRLGVGAVLVNNQLPGYVKIYDYQSNLWVQRGYTFRGAQFGEMGYCSLSNDGGSVAIGSPGGLPPFGNNVTIYCLLPV